MILYHGSSLEVVKPDFANVFSYRESIVIIAF